MNTGHIFWKILFLILIILLSEDLNPFQMCLFSLQDSCTTKWGLWRRLRTAHTGSQGSEGRLAYGFIYRFGQPHQSTLYQLDKCKIIAESHCYCGLWIEVDSRLLRHIFLWPLAWFCFFRTSRVVHFYSISTIQDDISIPQLFDCTTVILAQLGTESRPDHYTNRLKSPS